MFVRPLACAVLLVARVAAQESVPTAPTAPAEEPFMTIQTFLPTSISETEGPLTNPLQTETPVTSIPQLTFCDGVYTNTPCITATGVMSIPQGETPIPSSLLSSIVSSVAGGSSDAISSAPTTTPPRSTSRDGSVTRPIPTSSASGSVQETPSPTPGAAPSVTRGDKFAWAAVAMSGLSATLGFAWALL